MTGPMEAHSSCFSCDSAGNEEEPGRDIPSASMALAIVLAVYICVFPQLVDGRTKLEKGPTPPHAPGPGQACRTVLYRSRSAWGVLPSWRYLP